MANLYDPIIAGLPGPNMSADFGFRGSPSSNPIGTVAANDPRLAGAATILNSINQFRGVNDANPQATIAGRVNANNATLYPTQKGSQAFRDYVNAAYPDGKMPARIRELMDSSTRGGINDMGLAIAKSADEEKRRRAGTFDYGERIGGLGGGSPMQAIQGNSYLDDVFEAPVNLALAQDAAALGPTGPGMFGPVLAAASLFTPLSPIAAGLFSMYQGAAQQDPFQAIGGIGTVGAAAGAFNGLADAISSPFRKSGFVNPSAIDLSGAGTGANALGLTSPEQWSGLAGSGFINPSALATPMQINDAINYTPASLGGPPRKTSIKPILEAAKQLLPMAEEPQQPQQQGLLGPVGGMQQGYNPLIAPPPPDPMQYFRLATRAR